MAFQTTLKVNFQQELYEPNFEASWEGTAGDIQWSLNFHVKEIDEEKWLVCDVTCEGSEQSDWAHKAIFNLDLKGPEFSLRYLTEQDEIKQVNP